jgi:UDP-N-acetylglucosamine 2-epimerase (non-hydrolysing)
VRFEQELVANPADLVLVVGDVTSTMACAIVAQKLHTQVAHVEAGIRSGDWSMPEEINRLVTDSITNYYFTTSEVANGHLRASGIQDNRIFFVGNTMIDTLLKHRSGFIPPPVVKEAALIPQQYLVMTLHRPANVDQENQLDTLISEIIAHSGGLPVIFPVHPRTAKQLRASNAGNYDNLYLIEPLSYLEFNYLVEHARGVITDSGGITEETTVLGVPCITLRDNTERPETVTMGTNMLIGTNPAAIGPVLQQLLRGEWKKGTIPPLWDGSAGVRIVDVLLKLEEEGAFGRN